ncbi:MAG TPA: hypothetical protein VL137_15695, partial [Polyangiaceae bacterium]|nr:hypothetical protein [Polyangiaceae bacterium]
MSEIDPLEMDRRLGQAQRGLPDPVQLDRQVGRAHDAYQRWLRQLRQDPISVDEPLSEHRVVSSRLTFRDLTQLGDQDPLRSYLERWIFSLGESRVNAPYEQAMQRLCYHDPTLVHGAEGEPCTRSRLLERALAGGEGTKYWLDQYLQAAEPYSVLVREVWQRRAEIARRWGVDYDQQSGCGIAAVEAAQHWLDRTQDMFGELHCSALAQFVELACARDAQLDWPSRLSWRSLTGWFAGGELCSSLQVKSKALPARLAPASFLRGLCRLGEEWSYTLAPNDQFFVVAHEPYDLHTHTHAALFALLLCNDGFLKSALAAPAPKLPAARRALHRALLIESRVRAFKVLASHAALQGGAAFEEIFLGTLGSRFGFTVPSKATGSLFTPKKQAVQRFVGLMLAAAADTALTEAHDLDWFRNPRG